MTDVIDQSDFSLDESWKKICYAFPILNDKVLRLIVVYTKVVFVEVMLPVYISFYALFFQKIVCNLVLFYFRMEADAAATKSAILHLPLQQLALILWNL